VELNDFILDNTTLTVESGATGTLTQQGQTNAELIHANLSVYGRLSWIAGNIKLTGNSIVSISGEFHIESSGTVIKGDFADNARFVVQSGGWLGRVLGAEPGKTTFQVNVDVEPGGTFDSTDIITP
jgi:hypothetical protein